MSKESIEKIVREVLSSLEHGKEPAESADTNKADTGKGVRADVTETLGADSNRPADTAEGYEQTEKEKRGLSPEQMKELICYLEDRFNNIPENYYKEKIGKNREGRDFNSIKTFLKNNPESAYRVYASMKKGEGPDWLIKDDKIAFFPMNKSFPPESANCVYSKEDAEWLKNSPDESFNGSIEEQCEEMGGAGLQTLEEISFLHQFGTFEGYERAFDKDHVCSVIRYGGGFRIDDNDASNGYLPNLGWRASLSGNLNIS
jgi:hypothetical protein